MKFAVIQTKAGWAVQNTQTYVIAGLFNSKAQAELAASKLNK